MNRGRENAGDNENQLRRNQLQPFNCLQDVAYLNPFSNTCNCD